jgi:formate dehydrogenase subunit gamma
MASAAVRTPEPPSEVVRFTATEQALHWGFAFTYLLLLGSGFLLMIPELRVALRGYTPQIGLRLHLVDAVLWAGVVFGVLALGDRRRLHATWDELTAFGPEDRAWLRQFPRWLAASAAARAHLDRGVGRFNAGQKVNAVVTLGTSALLGVTGLALWPLDGTGTTMASLLTGPDSARYWLTAHRWLTLLVIGPLVGHIALAAVHPATRPALTGMVRGRVDRRWAAAHHPRWIPAEGDTRPTRLVSAATRDRAGEQAQVEGSRQPGQSAGLRGPTGTPRTGVPS